MRLLKCSGPKKCYLFPLSGTGIGTRISSARQFSISSNGLQGFNVDHLPYSNKNGAAKATALQNERDLFLSVLNAIPTKRDAKSYLSRFKPHLAETSLDGPNVLDNNELHVALVKIRAPQDLSDFTFTGLAQTLSHLGRLGLISVVVPDCTHDGPPGREETPSTLRQLHIDQADRLASTIQATNSFSARRLDCVLSTPPPAPAQVTSSTPVLGGVSVEYENMLIRTLSAAVIPVIPPIAYTTDTQRKVDVAPDDVMLALTREFVKLPRAGTPMHRVEAQPFEPPEGQANVLNPIVSVERIIILDPVGGLPSTSRPDKAHVFVNLEQEYRDIKRELQVSHDPPESETRPKSHSVFGNSNPISQFAEQEIVPAISTAPALDIADRKRHTKNLDVLQKALSLLPPSSSALLTYAAEAATLPPSEQPSSADLGVGTRSPRNPLIFNLLTDKPVISSSLPVSRLRSSSSDQQVQPGRSTFVKRGMSLTMIPDPRQETWAPPMATKPSLSLVDDSRIDFSRLLNLFEDSFNRKLDVPHFLSRIRNRIAGVIVAGEYEGGALLTWELPPGVADDGSEESRQRMVPYLDKFAVLRRSQGAGGVADVVFSAMVRSCFPQGVCWRSRKTNPVNKWYFERARGTWKLPDSEWSMFWTTHGLLKDQQKFLDYEGVCRAVEPSWLNQEQ